MACSYSGVNLPISSLIHPTRRVSEAYLTPIPGRFDKAWDTGEIVDQVACGAWMRIIERLLTDIVNNLGSFFKPIESRVPSPLLICGSRLDQISVNIEVNDLTEFEFTNSGFDLFAIADDHPNEIIRLDNSIG